MRQHGGQLNSEDLKKVERWGAPNKTLKKFIDFIMNDVSDELLNGVWQSFSSVPEGVRNLIDKGIEAEKAGEFKEATKLYGQADNLARQTKKSGVTIKKYSGASPQYKAMVNQIWKFEPALKKRAGKKTGAAGITNEFTSLFQIYITLLEKVEIDEKWSPGEFADAVEPYHDLVRKMVLIISKVTPNLNTKSVHNDHLRAALQQKKRGRSWPKWIRDLSVNVFLSKGQKVARAVRSEKVLRRKLTYRMTFHYDDLFRLATKLKEKVDSNPSTIWHNVILAQLCTGSRFVETLVVTKFSELTDAEFEANMKAQEAQKGGALVKNKEFEGHTKTAREQTIKIENLAKAKTFMVDGEMQIMDTKKIVPTWFLSAKEVVDLIKLIRKKMGQQSPPIDGPRPEENQYQTRKRVSSYNGKVNELLYRRTKSGKVSGYFQKKVTSHRLRGIYANLMTRFYSGSKSPILYIAEVLGHVGGFSSVPNYTNVRIIFGNAPEDDDKDNMEKRMADLEALTYTKFKERQEKESGKPEETPEPPIDTVKLQRTHGGPQIIRKKRRRKVYSGEQMVVERDDKKRRIGVSAALLSELNAVVKELKNSDIKPTWKTLRSLGFGASVIALYKRNN